MTIAIVLVPSSCESSTSTVVIQTVFSLSILSLIGVKASTANDSAKVSNRIYSRLFACV